MTDFKFGDVVLVPFPFSYQSSTKKRPAVVVSSAAYHQSRPDLILMAITSQASLSNRMGDISIRDWQAAGLLKASIVKPVMMTIERSLIIQNLGRLCAADSNALTQSIAKILGPT